MRGASRASLAEATQQLSAAAAGAAQVGQLGEDLFAVVGLLDHEPGLRRMLSDPTRDVRAKTGVVDALLDGKISATALRLVRGLAGARWSAPADLTDAAEQLAVLAIVETADAAGQLDDLEDELFRFGRIVNAESELRFTLSNPFIQADRKRALVDDLLSGKVTAATLRLVTQAAIYPRGRSLDASLEVYAGLAAQRRERLVAQVRVAAKLTVRQRSRLRAALSTMYGHEVHLNVVLDPNVVGGMSVQIGDELIDGSTASRLAELRRRLAA
jgi:F-type H+-transporting ATPase subunit delta